MNKRSPRKTSPKTASSESETKKDFLVVGLGASAGGIKALQEFFATIPPNSGMAFVVILHLSPQHESNLPQILQFQTTMPVIQVNKTHKVEPNHVYVIPPNRNLEMVDGTVRLARQEQMKGKRVVIDVFFRTLAEAYERNAVCIVMSGTGSDGTLGLKRIKESNGFAIVQAPEDSEYDQMPRSAIATGLADWILPVRLMPEKLIGFRDSSERMHLTNGGNPEAVGKQINAEESLREILTILRVRTGHDFSNYKTPTIIRRIARHLQIHELEDIPTYLNFLRDNREEIRSLQRNLLINVTNFFRDKEAFFTLEESIIPRLFTGKTSRDTVRIWSAGCASGEEVFSFAILLQEYVDKLTDPPKFQIFATDVDDEAIHQAREHIYPETIETDVSPERLKKFFIREGSRYRVKKELRETVLFAPHNVLRDPPFSKLDLISCRNLLIYLNREAQERVLEIFHFALSFDGFLFLGSSESAENMPELFEATNKKQRIYRRRAASHLHHIVPKMPVVGNWRISFQDSRDMISERVKAQSLGEVHYKLLENFAPPSVLINENFDIVYMSESVGRFLRFAGGEPSNNLLKLINVDLLPDLRAALFTAQRDRQSSEFPDVHAMIEGKETRITLIVRTVGITDDGDGGFLLVIFDELDETKPLIPVGLGEKNKKTIRTMDKEDAMTTVIQRLEDELQHTKTNLRATIEQHEVSIEELKASNEELQAINEELRSASEELETSKEELQSVNEELVTVNHELKDKMDEAAQTNSDLQNLISSTDIATIFLDRQLQIKRYAPLVEKLFNIKPSDIGRPLEHFTHQLKYDKLTQDAAEVLRTLSTVEREISDKDNRYFLTRFAPYRTTDDRIEGVVLNFLEVTKYKQAEEELQATQEEYRTELEQEVAARTAELNESREQFASLVENTPDIIVRWDKKQKLIYANSAFETKLGIQVNTVLGKTILEMEQPDNIAKPYMKSLQEVFRTGKPVEHFDSLPTSDGIIHLHSHIVPEKNTEGEIETILAIARDITERRQTSEALQKSESQLQLILESAKDYAIITFDLEKRVTRWNPGAERMFGYTEKEMLGKTGEILFTPEDRAKNISEKEFKIALEKGRAEDERFHLHKDGTRFFVSGVTQPLGDGEIQGFVKIARDQTERMETEKAIQEKEILHRLVSTQEDERRRIARDLHDHFGQQMTALRLKLESLKKNYNDEEISKGIDEADKIAEQLDADVDFLAWELRPASLDDLGLRLTLADYVKEWSGHTKINAEFHTSGIGKARLGYEIETNLYRIAQEAMNNIYKHAKAKNVSVLLEKHKTNLTLIIEDDGQGFNPNSKKIKSKGLGLTGMAERAGILGGTFEIESAPHKGTTIFVRIPIKKGGNKNGG